MAFPCFNCPSPPPKKETMVTFGEPLHQTNVVFATGRRQEINEQDITRAAKV